MFEESRVATTIARAGKALVHLYAATVQREEKNAMHVETEECYKEEGITRRFEQRFEAALEEVAAKLAHPQTRKKLDYFQRRIGKLQKVSSRVARHYTIKVTAITCNRRPHKGSIMSQPGVYALHTNILDLDAEQLWHSHTTSTDVETVFRSLKSEFGLRQIHHHREAVPRPISSSVFWLVRPSGFCGDGARRRMRPIPTVGTP